MFWHRGNSKIMRYRLNRPFLRYQLLPVLLVFPVFIMNLYSCFITPCYSDQVEYHGNTGNDAFCEENSRNVNRLDFDESEFRLPLSIGKLCEEIYPELTPNIKRHIIVINKDGRLCKPDSLGEKLIYHHRRN